MSGGVIIINTPYRFRGSITHLVLKIPEPLTTKEWKEIKSFFDVTVGQIIEKEDSGGAE